jgi:amidophosphoribosyltransferase
MLPPRLLSKDSSCLIKPAFAGHCHSLHRGGIIARGIIGIMRSDGRDVAPEVYEALLMLQHRAQDATAMVSFDGDKFVEKRQVGMVKDVYGKKAMGSLLGSMAIGQVQNLPSGNDADPNIQPYFINSPLGIWLQMTGRITNKKDLMVSATAPSCTD